MTNMNKYDTNLLVKEFDTWLTLQYQMWNEQYFTMNHDTLYIIADNTYTSEKVPYEKE